MAFRTRSPGRAVSGSRWLHRTHTGTPLLPSAPFRLEGKPFPAGVATGAPFPASYFKIYKNQAIAATLNCSATLPFVSFLHAGTARYHCLLGGAAQPRPGQVIEGHSNPESISSADRRPSNPIAVWPEGRRARAPGQ